MFSILRPCISSLDLRLQYDLAIKSLKANIFYELFCVEEEELLETKLFNKRSKIPSALQLDLIKGKFIIHF